MIRKIKTKEEIEKKNKKNQIIIGVSLSVLLVVSVLGFALFSADREEKAIKEYNGLKFIRTNELWKIELNEEEFYFNYLPQETDNVSIIGFYSLNNYINNPLYFVNHSISYEAYDEILRNIYRYVLRVNEETCLDGMNCTDPAIPIKTCEDNVIIFKDLNLSKEYASIVYQDNNCIYISGDIIRATDAFLYKLLGIK